MRRVIQTSIYLAISMVALAALAAGCSAPPLPFPFGSAPTPTPDFPPELVAGPDGGAVYTLLARTNTSGAIAESHATTSWLGTPGAAEALSLGTAEAVAIDSYPDPVGISPNLLSSEEFIADRTDSSILVESTYYADSIELPDAPTDLAFIPPPNPGAIIVGSDAGYVIITDGPSLEVVHGPPVSAIGVRDDGAVAMLALDGTNAVAIFDSTPGLAVPSPCPAAPDDIELSSDFIVVWFSSCSTLQAFDVDHDPPALLPPIVFPSSGAPVPGNHTLALSPSGMAYAAGDHALLVANLHTGDVHPVALPGTPTAITAAYGGELLWMVASSNGKPVLLRFDTGTESYAIESVLFNADLYARDVRFSDRAPLFDPFDTGAHDNFRTHRKRGFAFSALDVDGDPITYGAESLPEGARIEQTSPDHADFVWRPKCRQVGTADVVLTARSSRWLARERAHITVTNSWPDCGSNLSCEIHSPGTCEGGPGVILCGLVLIAALLSRRAPT